MKEVDLLQRKEAREDCISRVEVLDKVGELLLLPNTEYATINQVSNYYNVGQEAIRKLFQRNKEELVHNGAITLGANKIVDDILRVDKMSIHKTKSGILIGDNKLNYKSNLLFSKRAILNVGMLLRDSEVAKEIRTRLLDIVHDASKQNNNEETIVENVVNEISEERQLMLDRIEAEMNGDFETVCVINAKLFALKNKRIEELETEVENITTHALDIIESRKVINCLVRNIAVVKYGGKFGNAYNELYKKLNYQLGININARKQKNKLDSLSEEEMYRTEEIVRAWANDCGIDINDKLSLRA